MRVLILTTILACAALAQSTSATETAKARLLEKEGDGAGARETLARAASVDADAHAAYAEFLDRHRDPAARQEYEKLLGKLNGARANAVARRLVILDLVAGDRPAALRHYEAYKSSGGGDLTPSVLQPSRTAEAKPSVINIPGPLRSFARMAALSPDLRPEDVLAALARNVVTNGFQASASAEALEPTEYLKLVVRYLSQARELEKLSAANQNVLKIETCESPQTADLLRILGYRMRGGCGSDVVLETVNATRAFLTIDSGFPLAQLEQALRTNRPFVYDFSPTQAPVLYNSEFWMSAVEKPQGEFIDVFLSDPSVCRLYLGLSKLDSTTADALRKSMPPVRMKAFAHVLDFYGGMFEIRDGVAVVPGGERAWPVWNDLTGKNPKDGVGFFERLLTRDDGWVASYFDAIARLNGPVQDYLLDPRRIQRFYTAMRGRITSPGPARPVFRASTDLMLLTQRLRIENGRPHVPGGLDVWRNLFINHPHGKYDGKLTKLANGWKEPDDLVEALFALCRKAVENEPLKIYLALSDLNRFRMQPLESATVDRLAREWRTIGAQYSIFSEAPQLSDKSILLYVDLAKGVNGIGDMLLRADTAGTAQALTGLYQIFIRQGSLPAAQADDTFAALLSPFAKIRNHRELFDAGRSGVNTLLKATGIAPDASPQDRMVDLLAGTGSHPDADSHRSVVEGMIRVVEAQRLVSLNSIFQMADNLESLTRGERLNTALVQKLASRIAEIQLPRASLSSVERNTLAFGYWTEKHVEQQRKTNLRAAIDKAAKDPEKLRDVRGQLAPFLRDTLVGFNYAHYAPPGAQILQTNPLFVRSHDFLGMQGTPQTWKQTEVLGSGWPSSAGGRLVGSLSGLPYALAEAEQNFLIPSREQALIWGDLVPQMILMAKVPRWWNVTPAQTQWISLHLNHAETLVAEASFNVERRREFLALLSRHAPPARVRKVSDLLETGMVPEAVETVTPSEMYMVAADWLQRHPQDSSLSGTAIRQLATEAADQVKAAAISRAFGTPKPTLTGSYMPELLSIRTFPTLMGYSSRIMAESWESNLLYYAALAHDVYLPPSHLNVVVPEWTQQTVERIFATHLEDWPALLRSLRMLGDDVRTRARKQALAAEQKASLQ
ncbi:MAG TPA: hypothetical protein VES20_07330 [Bryobacteraceae bacterium]|nr:hypothetical protein [Bryobacteraceae bacterium]